jgi:hypothetical protein
MRSPIPVPRRLTFFVHASSLEQGGVAEDDLAQFEITDPHTSRFWQIRTGQFDGRQPTFRTPIRHFWELSTSRETPGSITVCSPHSARVLVRLSNIRPEPACRSVHYVQ